MWLVATHIPGKYNMETDEESRKCESRTEWKLNTLAFNNILHHFHPFTPDIDRYIDLFSSRLNTQLPCYISYRPDPYAMEINAFCIFWENLKFYCFPPFSCVARAIQKIILDKATGILVVPRWPNQPWYSMLDKISISNPLYLSLRKDLLMLPSSQTESHPLHRSLGLMAYLVSGNSTHNTYLQT